MPFLGFKLFKKTTLVCSNCANWYCYLRFQTNTFDRNIISKQL